MPRELPNRSPTNEAKYEITGDNEIDFIKHRMLQELLKTGFPLRGSMWGKPRSEWGGGGCRRIKHRSQGSGVEGCEGGAERNWGNEVSIHSWRTEDSGISLALRETQQVKGHSTFTVHSGVCADKVSKGETSSRRHG